MSQREPVRPEEVDRLLRERRELLARQEAVKGRYAALDRCAAALGQGEVQAAAPDDTGEPPDIALGRIVDEVEGELRRFEKIEKKIQGNQDEIARLKKNALIFYVVIATIGIIAAVWLVMKVL